MFTARAARAATVLLAVFGAVACESEHDVGSACPDGVCVETASNTADVVPCLFSSTTTEVILGSEANEGDSWLCLPHTQPVGGDGMVPCELRAVLPAESTSCEDLGLTAHVDPNASSSQLECDVPQLAVRDGALLEPSAQGFYYYDDFSPELAEHCPLAPQRIAWSDGLVLPAGTTTYLHCRQTLADPELVAPALGLDVESVHVEPDSCVAPPANNARGIGDPCMPFTTPDGGFDDRNVHVQTGASDCESDVCIVYHLRGEASSDCVEEPPSASDPGTSCPTQDDVEARVFCTCRCDDKQGGGCACPDGFSCVDALRADTAPAAGGYCVRNGTF